MLITSLLPLLSRYSLGFDLTAGADDTVTLTVIPRKAAGAKQDPESVEVRPISITASAAEIDEELAKGGEGALGQLIVARKALSDQIAEQRAAAEAAKSASAKAKPAAAKPATSKSEAKAEPPAPAAAIAAPVDPKPGEPASLW
jgi:PRTRC genetic system protein E